MNIHADVEKKYHITPTDDAQNHNSNNQLVSDPVVNENVLLQLYAEQQLVSVNIAPKQENENDQEQRRQQGILVAQILREAEDSQLKQLKYQTCFQIVQYSIFGFLYYFYSTNPVYYNGDSCVQLKIWGFAYSIVCFCCLGIKILFTIPYTISPNCGGGALKTIVTGFTCLESLSGVVFLIALTIVVSYKEPCGSLHTLALVHVILIWCLIPVVCCLYICFIKSLQRSME